MTAPPRILHVVLNDFTRDTRVERAARLGVEMGGEVRVAALWSRGLPRAEERDGFQVSRVQLRTRPLPRRRSVQLVKYGELIGRLLGAGRRWSPDLVHAHDFNALIPSALLAALCRAALLYDSHELWYDRMRGGEALPKSALEIGAAVERALARRADAVVTVSGGIADELRELLGVERPTVVRNVPELRGDTARRVDRPGPLRSALGLPGHVPVILYQGGMIPGRGVPSLVDAMGRLSHPTAVLVLLGSGPLVGPLRRRAERGNVDDRVHFHEAVSPDVLPLWTADADLGVSPIEGTCRSYELCLPNKLFEYIHAGLPVLVSDQPEMEALVRRHGVGRVFADGDVECLARRLDEMVGDPDAMERWRSAALVARQQLNWEGESTVLRGLYRELLGDAPGVRAPKDDRA